jgi:pimeloyl-ACP methyl ester carboxylesterase
MNTSMRVTRHFAQGPYGQVHYRMAGSRDSEKPPVICLHMSPKSGRSFEDLLPFLAKDRLVIAPDNPGHGESDLPPAEPSITLEDYARSMWVVVDSLVTVPVHLLGFHTGSMVAVEAASQCPDKVLSVINIGAPVYTAQ